MKKIYTLYLAFLTAFGCTQEGLYEKDDLQTVTFVLSMPDHFNGSSPTGKILAGSDWKHIFREDAILIITNDQTGTEYEFEIDPNHFDESYQIKLPYGSYSYQLNVSGEIMEPFLPFEAEGKFALVSGEIQVSIQAKSEYGLITVKNQHVKNAILLCDNLEIEMELTDDGDFYYMYAKEGNEYLLKINEQLNNTWIEEEIMIGAKQHVHYFLDVESKEGKVNFIELAIGEFEYFENSIIIGSNLVYDADGNPYPTLQIGQQFWMAENLKSSTYCNGDKIEENLSRLFTRYPPYPPSFINFERFYNTEGVESNFPWTKPEQFGFHYNFPAVIDERNICPCGWRVPSVEDWRSLVDYLGGSSKAGEKLAEIGFNIEPASYFNVYDEFFEEDGVEYGYYTWHLYADDGHIRANWWSSSTSESDDLRPYYFTVNFDYDIGRFYEYPRDTQMANLSESIAAAFFAQSVRCIKN